MCTITYERDSAFPPTACGVRAHNKVEQSSLVPSNRLPVAGVHAIHKTHFAMGMYVHNRLWRARYTVE